MTILTSEARLVGAGTATLPRVNLLPPEIAEDRAFRRIQMGLGAAVLASVGLVGVFYMSASNGLSSANDELAAATAQNTSLQAEAAKYRNVTALYQQADAAQLQLSTAMADEVRYSQLLNDLSLAIPGNVWVKNISFAASAPTAPTTPGTAATAATATATTAAAASAKVGTFTVTGIGFSHDDVAAWLESVAGLSTYSNPYFSNSTEALLGKKPIVNFTSTADVSSKALSGRYKAGGR